ncbi:hypothetical protein, partial [Pseudomonas aeruginosa]|uniref:hypothetical protein n=1 Tax=Pseudomonas aeruginosa TaxID=287 RepID=UPI000BD17A83
AIYAFRGADIHTYLRAREATRGRHYTLGKNFRSTAAMVAAANALRIASASARRLASVYLSDRDSVFDSQEAADLLHWLRACADPGADALLRV